MNQEHIFSISLRTDCIILCGRISEDGLQIRPSKFAVRLLFVRICNPNALTLQSVQANILPSDINISFFNFCSQNKSTKIL